MRIAILTSIVLLGMGCGGSPEAAGPEAAGTATTPVAATRADDGAPLRTLNGAALVDTSRAADAVGKPGTPGATSDVLEPGTVVRVVNPDTRQSVVVVIDDRAADASEPAHVRLSPQDALRIGMSDDRPMLVRLEVLDEPGGPR